MKIVQCSLSAKHGENIYSTLTVWLDVRPDLKEGAFVTLKDSDEPERLWKVESVGDRQEEKADIVIKGHSQAFFKRDMHRKNGSWENC